MDLLFAITSFALGAIIGSFLNVVIHRYPREESIVFPGSHCPHCGASIRFYDNVPILSYLWLLGRCRACRRPFSIRYPLVELANALFYLAIYLRTGLSPIFVLVAAIVSMTIALIYIDAEIQILPDVIDLPGVGIGLLVGAVAGPIPGLTLSGSFWSSVVGAVAGGATLLAIALAYRLLRNIEGMGLGDVKMLAMIGAVCGWEALFPIVLIASLSGAVFGLWAAASSPRGMQTPLPFGVFLGLGFLTVLFFGNELRSVYSSMLLPQ